VRNARKGAGQNSFGRFWQLFKPVGIRGCFGKTERFRHQRIASAVAQTSQSAVSRVSNPRAVDHTCASGTLTARRLGNRRHSRLETCATWERPHFGFPYPAPYSGTVRTISRKPQ